MSSVMISDSTMREFPNNAAMRVVGTSMYPTLEDGDVVLIDRDQTDPIDGSIVCVFQLRDGKRLGCVGRIMRSKRGARLVKDNPEWAGRSVFLGRTGSYEIAGVVVRIVYRRNADFWERTVHNPVREKLRQYDASDVPTVSSPADIVKVLKQLEARRNSGRGGATPAAAALPPMPPIVPPASTVVSQPWQ